MTTAAQLAQLQTGLIALIDELQAVGVDTDVDAVSAQLDAREGQIQIILEAAVDPTYSLLGFQQLCIDVLGTQP